MRMLLQAVYLLVAWAVGDADVRLVDAVRNGDVATVRALAARGIDLDAPAGIHGWTPLLHAVHTNQHAMAAALLDAGADPNHTAADGTTPLMMAAGYGNQELTALLLRRGADARLRDHDGDAAIDYALTGVNDLDRFTFFSCQSDTAALLASVSPQPQTWTVRWARMKRCTVPSPFSRF